MFIHFLQFHASSRYTAKPTGEIRTKRASRPFLRFYVISNFTQFVTWFYCTFPRLKELWRCLIQTPASEWRHRHFSWILINWRFYKIPTRLTRNFYVIVCLILKRDELRSQWNRYQFCCQPDLLLWHGALEITTRDRDHLTNWTSRASGID